MIFVLLQEALTRQVMAMKGLVLLIRPIFQYLPNRRFTYEKQ